MQDSNLKQEVDSFQKIAEASPSASKSIQVSRLLGYVKHAENRHIIGLLREWRLRLASSHGQWRFHYTQRETGEVGAQVHKTVDQLHEIGTLWGDGKLHNTVIGNDDNVWLVDFRGD